MKIVTTAFPFVPANLGIHNMASTYLPADIFVRALRLLEEDVIFVNATDFHSIYATKNGLQDIELCNRYHKTYLEFYQYMNICFDRIITTDDPCHKNTVKKCLDSLNHNDLLYEKASNVIYCENCKTFIPNSFIVDNKESSLKICDVCKKSELIYKKSLHVWLQLSKCKDLIEEYSSNISQKDVIKISNSFLNNIQDWDFTRDNKFGIRYNDRLSLYLWFESLIGYYSLIPEKCKNHIEFHHFIGKNIIYYHTIVWPVILNALCKNKQCNIDVSARGFLNEKSEITLDIKELCKHYDTDIVRFYFTYKVKDSVQDFIMNETELKDIKRQIVNGPINFINRCLGLLKINNIIRVAECDKDYIDFINEKYIQYIVDAYKNHKSNRALKLIMKFVKFSHKELTHMVETNLINPNHLVFLAIVIALLLSPIVPIISKKLLIVQVDDNNLNINNIQKYMSKKIVFKNVTI